MSERNASFLGARLEPGAVVHDPAGPLILDGPIALEAEVRAALGDGAWVEMAIHRPGVSLFVGDDAQRCALAAAAGVPVVMVSSAGTPAPGKGVTVIEAGVLSEWLRAFADGECLGPREAGLRTWLGAVRLEELRNQREAIRIDREERLAMRRQLDDLSAHVAGIEASKAWVLSRRMIDTKASIVARLPKRLRRALG